MNMLGVYGEVLAARYLRDQGQEILTTNYRCHLGEIDIISIDGGDTIVFTEVKTRISRFVPAIDCVNESKKKRIVRVARVYSSSRKLLYRKYRFDVCEVYMKDNHNVESIILHKNYFG